MCFLVLAYRQHPIYPLVLVANRDEFYARPTAPAAFWKEAPRLLAGRDLQGKGTWMGVTQTGRLAALTNVREPRRHMPDAPTRGALVVDFLTGSLDPGAYLEDVRERGHQYNGFNLLVGEGDALYYGGNRIDAVRRLGPGLYGLSNDVLDTPWPKVVRGKERLAEVLSAPDVSPERLLDLLADTEPAPDDAVPDTGVGLEWERILSPIFIQSPSYGTRASTVVLFRNDGRVTFVERAYTPDAPEQPHTRQWEFEVQA